MFSRLLTRALKSYQDHLVEFWALMILMCVAAALRLTRLPEHITWNGDTARDLIVARHLWEYHDPLALGHSAYGLRIESENRGEDPYGMSHYPTYFFRLMAIVWGVSGSVFHVALLQVLYQLLGMVILYVGIRQLFGKSAAWLTLLLIALSSFSIDHSLSGAIHLTLPLFYTVFTCLVLSQKYKKTWLMVFSALLCVLGSLLHYAFLLCFVWVIGIGIFSFWRAKHYRAATLFGSVVTLAGIMLFFTLHLEVIQFYGIWPFVGTFTGQYQQSVPLGLAQYQVFDLVLNRLSTMFTTWPEAVAALTVGLVGLVFSSRKDLRAALTGFIGFALSLVILVATKSASTFHIEQVLFFDYTLLILLGSSCGIIFELPRKANKVAMCFIIGLTLASSTQFGYRFPVRHYTLPIAAAEAHAKELLVKNPYLVEDTAFYVTSYYSWDYETPTVVFWLEELSGKKLMSLVDTYNNLNWEGTPKQHIIVSCQRFPGLPAMEQRSCQTFLQHFTENGTYFQEKELFSNEHYRSFLYKKR